ncbi:hypothetical protein ACFPOH_01795 [Ureibacillus suwonensis]|uniref:Uncharacterized protein n=1 Tax=Ureibacillus suwonensis TaxID=313007 RepID=A0ABW0R8V7_9BACL
MKEVLSYEDIEQIRYVKTRAKMGYAYTIEVKRKDKWSSIYFSTTFLKNAKERERFKRAWRKHTNMNFKHRKGYFLY